VVGKAIAGGALLYLVVRLAQVLWAVKDAAAVPAPGTIPGLAQDSAPPPWGSMPALGTVLFRDHLFVFEAVSIVLLVAVVGAIAVARPSVSRAGGPPQHLLDAGGDDE
jgi:NADH-quinone oxidoreductase subunit J